MLNSTQNLHSSSSQSNLDENFCVDLRPFFSSRTDTTVVPTRIIIVHFEIALRHGSLAALFSMTVRVYILVQCGAGSFESHSDIYVRSSYSLFSVVEAVSCLSVFQFPLFRSGNDWLACE